MKMTKEKHLELVEAWWDGRLEFKLEHGSHAGQWTDASRGRASCPHSYEPPSCYRIRPQPKLRPWKPEEVPVGAEVRSKTETWRGLITLVGTDSIVVGLEPYNFTIALIDLEHSTDGGKTWKPCGVEE